MATQPQQATTETEARGPTWLRSAAIVVLVVALLAGILLPVYTDEVGWRLQERWAFDGVDKLYSEICGPNTLAHPPFWMMPARAYSALFNALFPAPIYLRLSGILYALVWLGLGLELVRRAADGRRARVALSTIAVGLVSLGTLPLLLVLSRPEQPIMLAFTGAMLIAAADWKSPRGDTSRRTAWLRSLAVLALALVAMSYHVKAVATVPLFLVCLALASRGRGAIVARVAVAAVLVAAAAWAARYWVDRFACPDDDAVRGEFLSNTGAAIVSSTGGSKLGPLLAKALGNVELFLYPGHTAPRVEPMSFWLPVGQISAEHSFLWFLATTAVWAVALLAGLYCLIYAAQRAWRERRLDGRAVLSVTLVATVLAWSATGFVNVYEATFAVPMLMFAVVLALSTWRGGTAFAGGVRAGAAGLGVLGMVSIALVAAIYGPALLRAAQYPGYVKGQPYSITPFGYAGARRDIVGAARQCGIGEHSQKLVIDDMTYFPFMRNRLPEHRGGLFLPIFRGDPMAYLRSIGSDGVIASCQVLPPAFRARAKRQGEFCCVAPPWR